MFGFVSKKITGND